MAVQVLKARGVPEEHILFLNLIASPEGVKNFSAKFPRLRVVTAFIDEVRHLACLYRCRPLTNRLSPGPRREEVWIFISRYTYADHSTAISFLDWETLETDSTPSKGRITVAVIYHIESQAQGTDLSSKGRSKSWYCYRARKRNV